MRKSKKIKIWSLIAKHISDNKKEYILITLIFLVGIFLGVMFINNTNEQDANEIKTYLLGFIEKLKNTEKLNNTVLLKESLKQNILLGILLWFFGTTVIGIPLVFGLIFYRGFCLGYTISTIIITMGIGKGMIFSLIILLLQNIIFIPAIIAIGVSGLKLYKSIIKNKNRENIRIEVLRHTIFSGIMLLVLCVSACIEILISTNFLKKIIKYF